MPIPADQRGGRSLRNTSPGPATNPGAIPIFMPPQLAHGALDWQKTMDKIGGGDPAELAKNVRIDPVIEQRPDRGRARIRRQWRCGADGQAWSATQRYRHRRQWRAGRFGRAWPADPRKPAQCQQRARDRQLAVVCRPRSPCSCSEPGVGRLRVGSGKGNASRKPIGFRMKRHVGLRALLRLRVLPLSGMSGLSGTRRHARIAMTGHLPATNLIESPTDEVCFPVSNDPHGGLSAGG